MFRNCELCMVANALSAGCVKKGGLGVIGIRTFCAVVLGLCVFCWSGMALAQDNNEKKIVGTWVGGKALKLPVNGSLKFTKDGKFKAIDNFLEREITIEGTYKVEKDKLTVMSEPFEQALTIKKLTDDTMELEDNNKKVHLYKKQDAIEFKKELIRKEARLAELEKMLALQEKNLEKYRAVYDKAAKKYDDQIDAANKAGNFGQAAALLVAKGMDKELARSLKNCSDEDLSRILTERDISKVKMAITELKVNLVDK